MKKKLSLGRHHTQSSLPEFYLEASFSPLILRPSFTKLVRLPWASGAQEGLQLFQPLVHLLRSWDQANSTGCFGYHGIHGTWNFEADVCEMLLGSLLVANPNAAEQILMTEAERRPKPINTPVCFRMLTLGFATLW